MEVYAPDSSSVRVDIQRVECGQWLATHTRNGKTAKFRFDLGWPDEGKFFAEPGSDASELVASLQLALHAKHMPSLDVRKKALSFTYALPGENQSRVPGCGFQSDPAGDWFMMKLYSGKRQTRCISISIQFLARRSFRSNQGSRLWRRCSEGARSSTLEA